MRADFDLQFLQYCDNEDLVSLCNILMFDNNGNLRLSERLSNSDSWLECFPYKMRDMWEDLAYELQSFGGNTLLNVFRNGRGPSYESIVFNVCKHLRVKGISKHDTAEDMEQKLLIAVSTKAIGEMSEEQARAIMEECGVKGYNYSRAGLVAAVIALQMVNRRLFITVINSVMRMLGKVLLGRGVMMAGMGAISRGVSALCGPIGWIVLGGWTAWDMMGPAYRVTVPAVIQVAYMRVKYQAMLNSQKVAV